jgi:SchA/CurD like domain
MSLAAITYRVKPGHEDEIAEIFTGFKRVDSPFLRDETGETVGLIYGTGLFIKGGLMVRVIQYEGRLEDVARHMATQDGVHEIEDRLAPYLEQPRATHTVEGFVEYFNDSTMRCIQQLSMPPDILERMLAQLPRVPAESNG